MREVEKELFKIIKNNNDLELYEEILKLINKKIEKVRQEDAINFDNVLTDLINSENNAGWEDRHSQRIDYIRNASRELSDRIPDFY